MSTKYSGGIITKSPVTPAGPYETGAAPGVWTVEQALQYTKQGIWPTAGLSPNYIEDVFSTYLYAGNDTTNNINNGVDLSTYGGLVWMKSRSSATSNFLCDTARGRQYYLYSNATLAQQGPSASGRDLATFNTNGFTLGQGAYTDTNYTGTNYVSWTFREQPKFFDVVTYTGNGSSSLNVSHNLGSVPGCIVWKRTDSTSPWGVWHRGSNIASSLTGASLNTTDVFAYTVDGTTHFTSTYFQPSWINAANGDDGNISGASYVAYLFAHDAGGFGLTGTDNVISCGSYTGNGSTSGPTVTLGYEPQFVMIKAAVNVRTSPTSYNNWAMVDMMRGMPNPSSGTGYALGANLSDAENGGYLTASSTVYPTATGFNINSNESMYNYNGCTYIYIAIRRGPMKTPTVGTSVFAPVAQTGGPSNPIVTGFRVDASIAALTGAVSPRYAGDRLRGSAPILSPNDTTAEYNDGTKYFNFNVSNTGIVDNLIGGNAGVWWNFQRAPGFFDEVCYTGDSTAGRTITHNLGVAPELMLIKSRSNARGWAVYASAIGNNKYLILNGTNAALTDATIWVNTAPTSSVFTVGDPFDVNNTAYTYVAYLFATCAGVSKVGTYTGTGATQTVNCGFTTGARFVLIKRTDSTGDWYVWDSARGIIPANDPYLLLNSTAAEVTGTDYIDTTSVGFDVTSTAPAAINANGGTFIFLAIA